MEIEQKTIIKSERLSPSSYASSPLSSAFFVENRCAKSVFWNVFAVFFAAGVLLAFSLPKISRSDDLIASTKRATLVARFHAS
jgi:hypothetical protein